VAVEVSAAFLQQLVTEKVERTLRSDVGIQLADRPRGEVAWIGEGCKTGTLALLIELLKASSRHQQFAADFKIRRNAGLLQLFFCNREWNGADRAHVQGNIFACGAITACNAPRQVAVVVAKGER